MRYETQQALEDALVFIYRKIQLQREVSGWKTLRLVYYKERCGQRTRIGSWDTERRAGWLLVLPWALSEENPPPVAEDVESANWQGSNNDRFIAPTAPVMPARRV